MLLGIYPVITSYSHKEFLSIRNCLIEFRNISQTYAGGVKARVAASSIFAAATYRPAESIGYR